MICCRPVWALALSAWSCQAAGSSLGLVTADGEFKLNQSSVRGNATLTEGALVETLAVPSQLKLQGGATLRLDAGSSARVYADRVAVESGSGEWSAASGTVTFEALTLRVAAEEQSSARFRLASAKTVQLSASRGRFRVMNAQGTLISRLEPGLALAFEPQLADSGSAPSSFIGCIVKKDSKWMLYEPTLKLLVELNGQSAQVAREWGNRVQANGTSLAGSQTAGRHVMTVTTVTHIEAGGCEEMARLAGAEVPAKSTAAPAATSKPPVTPRTEGLSAGTKYGIIAAVVGGGAVAGIAAAGGKRSR